MATKVSIPALIQALGGKYHRQHRGGIVDHAEGNAEEAVAGHAVGN